MENIFSIKERILQFAKFQNISIEDFLSSIDMTYGSFKGKAKKMSINSDALVKIYTLYPHLNFEWLLVGSGEMIKSEPTISKRCEDRECKSCKEKDERIAELKEHISLLKEKIASIQRSVNSDLPQTGSG